MSTNLSSEQVGKQIEVLNLQFEEARKLLMEAERDGRRINYEIKALQNQCPHEKVRMDFVQDVIEMKLARFCTYCGAQC